MRRVSAALIGFACAACSSHPAPLPPGPGVVAFDRSPPEGVAVVDRPEWKVGDRFVFRRGGEQRIEVRVQSVDERQIVLVDELTGALNRIDRDYGSLSLDLENGESITRWDPVDARFSWPLWVGKRWSCRYVVREDGADMPIRSEYQCDARETITVPAGEFETLRIWRRSRPLADGQWLDRTDVYWYAPSVGQVVRRLDATVLTELEGVQRQ
ncbi:MAG: hypothetical protein U1F36_06905 [Planctomycetota bacterium]